MDSLIHWFLESLIHCFVASLILWFIDSLIHWFHELLIHCFVASLILWFTDALIHWFIDSLTYWFIDSFSLLCMDSFMPFHWLASQPPFAHSLMHLTTSTLRRFCGSKLSYRPYSCYSALIFRNFRPPWARHYLVKVFKKYSTIYIYLSISISIYLFMDIGYAQHTVYLAIYSIYVIWYKLIYMFSDFARLDWVKHMRK